MKAFLSHASVDKELVVAVANALGRQYSLVDQQVFVTGEDFKRQIIEHLDNASVFVLFASKMAIESFWVNFEIDEAFSRKIRQHIKKVLVYLIDSSVTYKDIPPWLQNALVKNVISPKIIAREVRQQLDEIFREREQKFFYGRNNDLISLQKELMPIDGSQSPRIFVICGLPGIGRRTFVKHGGRDFLSLKRSLVINIEEGQTLKEIAIEVANSVTPFSTYEMFEKAITWMRNSSDDIVLSNIIKDLRFIVSNGELPVFFDAGGIVDENGNFTEPVRRIINAFAPDDEAYLAIVTRRRPSGIFVPTVHLDPLDKEDVKGLLFAVANEVGLKLTATDVNDLSDYIGGYPPSAYYACRLAKDYGPGIVIHDKTRLVDFRASAFVNYLKTLAFDENHKIVLRLLTTYSPLPIQVIGDASGLDPLTLTNTLIFLRDHALITVDGFSNYHIADPVGDAINRMIGFTGEAEARVVIKSISELISEDGHQIPHVDVLRVAFRAKALINDPDYQKSFHFTADIIRLMREYYHRRWYPEAAKFAKIALEEVPDNQEVHGFLVRSLAQDERFEEARKTLESSARVIKQKDYYYNLGFILRKQGETRDAIENYKLAINSGRGGVGVYRDLAQCYMEEGNESEALKYIQKAFKIKKDNRFVVDLKIVLSLRTGDEKGARDGLEQLKLIEEENFYQHRLSSVELKFGSAEEAYKSAKRAVDLTSRPTFGMLGQLAQTCLRTNRTDEAKNIIEELSRTKKIRDIANGLKCRYFIEIGNYKDAIMVLNEIRNKNKLIYKYMRRDALMGELRASALPAEVRLQYERELHALDIELSGTANELDFLFESSS